MVTPHCTNPFRRTPSSVGVAPDREGFACVAGADAIIGLFQMQTKSTAAHAQPATVPHHKEKRLNAMFMNESDFLEDWLWQLDLAQPPRQAMFS